MNYCLVGGQLGEECQQGQDYMMATNIYPLCNDPEDCGVYTVDTLCVTGKCYCSRKDGFALNKTSKLCDIQIDECKCGFAECEHNCTDMDPSDPDNLGINYKCTCREGYFLTDIHSCNDTNECLIDNFCGPAADCENTNGSFICTCHQGWQVNPDTGKCKDIDECEAGTDNCDFMTQNCDNEPGSYSCSCVAGYTVDPSNSSLCIDVDECVPNQGLDACGISFTSCSNSAGSYFCNCKSGYEVPKAEAPRISPRFSNGAVENGDVNHDEDGLLGMFNRSEMDLTCHWDGMEVFIPIKPKFNNSKIDLSLLDSDCMFDKYGKGLFYYIYFKYHNCSSLKSKTNESVVYTQHVLVNDSVTPMDQSEGSLLAVAHSNILAILRCEYFRESVLMNSLLVENNPVRLTESGSFKVDLLMYTDATYTQEHSSYPVPVSLGEQLHFAAALTSTDPNLRLSLHACWITPNNNFYSPLRLYISQDFCPVGDDFEYVVGLRRNWFVPFTYKAQLIVANDGSVLDNVYYICHYDLCDLTAGDNFETCQDETNSCSRSKRQKRSLGSSSSSSGRITSHNVISGMLSLGITITGLNDQALRPKDGNGEDVIRITTPHGEPRAQSQNPPDDNNMLYDNDVTVVQKTDKSSTAAIASLAAAVGFLLVVIGGSYLWKMRAKSGSASGVQATTPINVKCLTGK
ncbi:uncharacterized protein LOC142351895 [Convolutriloba macropyga]|uniref:uncharacterized protein LOC142351895 n=1 Tax=Convolutriloba macropyga TaxID=536237 RepID=UPI003F5234D9